MGLRQSSAGGRDGMVGNTKRPADQDKSPPHHMAKKLHKALAMPVAPSLKF
jgi:hypothetical protein